MRHAVILAGGTGARLWPASRSVRPKQLLPLAPGGETLLAAAVRRARGIAGDQVLIVTAESQLEATLAVAPGVTVLAEPIGRNTAAALGLAAATIELRDRDAMIVVLPADQHVADEPELIRILELGCAAVERDDVIGTIGITPTRAETGFGYLEIGAAAAAAGVTPVLRFVEKPDRATAELYVRSGRFLWNAGMFLVSAQRLLHELDVQLPVTGRAVREIAAGRALARDLYPSLPSVSIDHAVMEHAERVVAIRASVGWDDVGSWASIPALLGVDDTQNTATGPALILDGSGNIVMSDDDTLIATVGLSDVVVVKSGNAILVIRKDQVQDVRKVVDALSARGLARYL